MSLVVVGGHSRNIGKTSVVAGVIRSFPDLGWTALKITQYGHGVCSINGAECGCSPGEHPFAVEEEWSRDGRTDSSRFLAAGARRAFWIRTRQGQLGQAMSAIRPLIQSGHHVIVESNSILRYLEPDLYLTVLSAGVADFKPSAAEFLPRANAAVLVDAPGIATRWHEVDDSVLSAIPSFVVRPPEYVSPELRAFLDLRLARAGP